MELTVIHERIFFIREQRVMLDFDLATLYGVETKRLKEAVKRNVKRFPADFMFELTQDEYRVLRSQIASLETSGKGKHSAIYDTLETLLDKKVTEEERLANWKKKRG